jgi:hypothetical protein
MRDAPLERRLDRPPDSFGRERTAFDQEYEVEQIAHAAVSGACRRSRCVAVMQPPA